MLSDNRLRELWDECRPHQRKYGNTFECFARAVEAEVRKMALDEAAELAIERTKKYTDFSTSWHVAADCAKAIRALAKGKP